MDAFACSNVSSEKMMELFSAHMPHVLPIHLVYHWHRLRVNALSKQGGEGRGGERGGGGEHHET